jgi:hypothetical protein
MWNVNRGDSEKPKESLEFSSANVTDLASSVAATCKGKDDEQPCLERTILALTDPYGPEPTMQTLTSLIADGTLHSRGDYHDFVHRIGRLTAKKGGLNPDAFFLCPVDYNYGCQHGFFEQALIEKKLRENGFGVEIFPSQFDKTMGFLWAKNKKKKSS